MHYDNHHHHRDITAAVVVIVVALQVTNLSGLRWDRSDDDYAGGRRAYDYVTMKENPDDDCNDDDDDDDDGDYDCSANDDSVSGDDDDEFDREPGRGHRHFALTTSSFRPPFKITTESWGVQIRAHTHKSHVDPMCFQFMM